MDSESPAHVEWRVDLAETYVYQALIELTTAFDTDRPGSATALRQRVEGSRRSIIFAAFAAEAYINRFLAQMLSAADYDAQSFNQARGRSHRREVSLAATAALSQAALKSPDLLVGAEARVDEFAHASVQARRGLPSVLKAHERQRLAGLYTLCFYA